MSCHRYPNRERALRQLDRHHTPAAPRQSTEFEPYMARQATAALTAATAAFRPYVRAMQAASAQLTA